MCRTWIPLESLFHSPKTFTYVAVFFGDDDVRHIVAYGKKVDENRVTARLMRPFLKQAKVKEPRPSHLLRLRVPSIPKPTIQAPLCLSIY